MSCANENMRERENKESMAKSGFCASVGDSAVVATATAHSLWWAEEKVAAFQGKDMCRELSQNNIKDYIEGTRRIKNQDIE